MKQAARPCWTTGPFPSPMLERSGEMLASPGSGAIPESSSRSWLPAESCQSTVLFCQRLMEGELCSWDRPDVSQSRQPHASDREAESRPTCAQGKENGLREPA